MQKILLNLFLQNNFVLTLVPATFILILNVIYGIIYIKYGLVIDLDSYVGPLLTGIIVIFIQQWNTFQVDLYKDIYIGFVSFLKTLKIFVTEFLSKVRETPLIVDTTYPEISINKIFDVNSNNERSKKIKSKIKIIKSYVLELPKLAYYTLMKDIHNYPTNEKMKPEYIFEYYIHQIKEEVVNINFLGGISKELIDHTFDELNMTSQSYGDIRRIEFRYPRILFIDLLYPGIITYHIVMIISLFPKYGWMSLLINYLLVYFITGVTLSSGMVNNIFFFERKRFSHYADDVSNEINNLFLIHNY